MKVHFVKKARKDYPEDGIKKGESYYWWKPRYGGIRRSKTYPSRQELTQSEFLCRVYDIEDELSVIRTQIETNIEGKNKEEIEELIRDALEMIIIEIGELRDECEDKLYNMPKQLQDTSEAGILLQERIDALEDWISELENIDISIEDDDDIQERVEEILDEISECGYRGD